MKKLLFSCALIIIGIAFFSTSPAQAQVGKTCPGGNSECASGTICSPTTLKCVVEPGCTTDDQCGTGSKCNAGKCVVTTTATCTSNSGCATGQTCNAGKCISGQTACTTNASCGNGQTCNAGKCVTSPTATPSTGTTPAGTTSTVTALTNPLKISSAGDLIKNLINFILGFVGVIAAAMIVYGGIVYMTSAGNDQRIQQGKNILTYAIVGLIISIAAGIIVNLVLAGIGAA